MSITSDYLAGTVVVRIEVRLLPKSQPASIATSLWLVSCLALPMKFLDIGRRMDLLCGANKVTTSCSNKSAGAMQELGGGCEK